MVNAVKWRQNKFNNTEVNNFESRQESLQDEIVVNTCKSWRKIDLGAMKLISKASFILHAKHEDDAGTINCAYNLVEMSVYQNRDESFLNARNKFQTVFRDDSHCWHEDKDEAVQNQSSEHEAYKPYHRTAEFQ